MRRIIRSVEREPDGSRIIAPDHLETAVASSSRSADHGRLDRELVEDAPVHGDTVD